MRLHKMLHIDMVTTLTSASAKLHDSRTTRTNQKQDRRPMNQAILATVLGFLFTLCAAAADAPPEPASAATPIVLKAAHLFDGKSGQLQSPGMVVVQGKNIVSVGLRRHGACGCSCDRPRRCDAGARLHRCAHAHLRRLQRELGAGLLRDALRFRAEQALHACAQRARDAWPA